MGYTTTDQVIITGAHTVFDPADSTPYFFGLLGGSVPSGSDIYAIPISVKGSIRTAVVRIDIGTVGTAEASTLAIRLNATTDYTISAAVDYDTKPQTIIVTNLNIPVNIGDFISFKLTTPAWATNPLQLRQVVSITIEC
jgi:hypothetical protein